MLSQFCKKRFFTYFLNKIQVFFLIQKNEDNSDVKKSPLCFEVTPINNADSFFTARKYHPSLFENVKRRTSRFELFLETEAGYMFWFFSIENSNH